MFAIQLTTFSQYTRFVYLLIFSTGFTLAAKTLEGPLPPLGLRCGYFDNPTVIDVRQPRFFWAL